jgi:hypothetical protein
MHNSPVLRLDIGDVVNEVDAQITNGVIETKCLLLRLVSIGWE